MSDLAKRLRASVRMDAVNGDSMERSVCAKQMLEAANRITELEAAQATTPAAVPEEQLKQAMMEGWEACRLASIDTLAALKLPSTGGGE